MSHHSAVVIEESLLRAVRDLILRDLKDDGYELRPMESQDWPVHYNLTKPNMDGTLELFFGPILRDEHGLRLSSLMVREETIHEESVFPKDATAENIARTLWEKISAHAIGLLQTSHSPSAEVGRGLDPLSKRSAELGDARSDSALADE